MKKTLRILTCMLTVLSLLLTPALASEDDAFREYLPEAPFAIGPQWTEREIQLQSGLGTLRGTLTTPKEVTGPMPVAILLHGVNTDRHWCDDIAWCLADHGIASVRFDFGGNGLSDGAQEDMTISSEIQDTLAILDSVECMGLTDRDNIFLIGKSLGAVAATVAASERRDEIKAMCLWYAGFSTQFSARFGYFLGRFFNPWDPPETLEIAGYTYGREFLREAVTMEFTDAVEACSQPVLLIHGDRDFVAPLVGSFWAQSHFPNAVLHVVPGAGHGFWPEQEFFALTDMLGFLEKQIG